MTQLPTYSQTPPGSTRLVVVALVVAAVALFLVNGYIELMRRQVQEDALTVYRLTRSVEPGTVLEEGMIVDEIVPDRFRDAFRNAVSPTGLQARLGQPLQRHANRNDLLTYDLFTNPEERELDRRIGHDSRLIPLAVRHPAPARLRPGVYVDIEAAFPSGGAAPRVLTVMERVQVMAVGERTIVDESDDGRGGGYRATRVESISIAVPPDQATQLSRISRIILGEFELHMRNPGDMGEPKIPGGGINPEVLEMLGQR